MGQKENDGYSRQGAAALARTIVAFWHMRGFSHVTAEVFPLPDFLLTYGVRSNLVNGLPPIRR